MDLIDLFRTKNYGTLIFIRQYRRQNRPIGDGHACFQEIDHHVYIFAPVINLCVEFVSFKKKKN